MTDTATEYDGEAALRALAGTIRSDFQTDQGVDRWVAIVVLSVLDSRRVEPSDWQLAYVRFLVRCDLRNLRRQYVIEPEYARAVAMWSYVEGGADRLRALAEDGPPPLAELATEAERRYRAAAAAGEDLDARFAADDVQAARDLPAWRAVSACAAMVPQLTGALMRSLESRWQ